MLRKPLIVLAQLSAELQELSWLRFFGGCYFRFWGRCYFAIWTVSGFRIMCPVILSPNVASFWLFRYTLSGLDGVIIPIIGATAISLVVYLLCMVLLAMRWPVGVGDLLLAIFDEKIEIRDSELLFQSVAAEKRKRGKRRRRKRKKIENGAKECIV